MDYTNLGKTGLKVSKVSLGTWQVGGGWGKPFDKNQAKSILHTALDAGINFFDTADVYDGQQSERVVGQLVKENRDERMIATKIGRRISPHVAAGYTPDILEQYVDEALFNTGLDELDLVQLHCPPTEVYGDESVFNKLAEIKQKGKVKHFGVSVEKTSEAIQATRYDVVETVQIIFNMFRLKPMDECFPLLKKRNVGVLARVPLASGLLSGKIDISTTFHENDHRQFNREGQFFDKGETFSGIPFEEGIKAVEELKQLFGHTELLYQYAIRWVLMHKAVSTVIPGASKPGQVIGNVASLELSPFTPEQMEQVLDVYRRYFKETIHQQW